MARIIDLFSGIGGASYAIQKAYGYNFNADYDSDEILAIDSNPEFMAIYKENFPKAIHIVEDARTLNPNHFSRNVENELLWASPPCAELITPNGKPEDSLLFEVLRWTTELMPVIVFVENIPALGTWNRLDEWLKGFADLGYQSRRFFLNADKYGAATSRNRLFIVFLRTYDCKRHHRIGYPCCTHGAKTTYDPNRLKKIPIRDCLDLEKPTKSFLDRDKPFSEAFLQNVMDAHKSLKVNNFIVKYLSTAFRQKITTPLESIQVNERFILIDWAAKHYRLLTYKEAARAQGFGPDFRWNATYNGKPVGPTTIFAGLGNSVSPPPAIALLQTNNFVKVC